MRLATVLTPLTVESQQLAAQCGVTDLVYRYPGPGLEPLLTVKRNAASFGLDLSVIEGYLPLENIKLGRDDGAELASLKDLIVNMGRADIPILCYNFMPGTDWVRTRLDVPERGGAKVSAFHLADVEKAILLGHDGADWTVETVADAPNSDELWANLEQMLRELVPVAEAAGVTLAMHADDPPLPKLLGKARIMNSVEDFERLVRLIPSPRNAICFCQGTFAEMGVNIPATIRQLGEHIAYVHFRDVHGTPESFTESFHDNGSTDMFAAIAAYQEIGFRGPIRPDHVPQLAGEDDGEPGYTMKGRLFAYGYILGLAEAARHAPF
jgi:mannonate dehydratase